MNKFPILLILMLSLVLTMGCAKSDWIQQTLVTADVTGTWRGSTPNGFFQLELEQQGAKVKGSILGTGVRVVAGNRISGRIEGSVAGDLFTFRQTDGSVTGEMTVNGDEMSGQFRVTSPENILLQRIK